MYRNPAVKNAVATEQAVGRVLDARASGGLGGAGAEQSEHPFGSEQCEDPFEVGSDEESVHGVGETC